MKKDRKDLREGFTTGSAAAAAAAAAMEALAGGPPETVLVDLPLGGRLQIAVHSLARQDTRITATIRKDAGDDPDITDKAIIGAIVTPHGDGDGPRVSIRGGRGVGKVTRPGLPVRVGKDAINPVPRSMIIHEVTRRLPAGHPGVSVEIFVEDGERLAEKTLNPRLGIVGGLSILGTTGIVKPFSAESYRETINLCVQGAKREGIETLVFSTGGKSERLIRGARSDLPEAAFIQIADFLGYAIAKARELKFRGLILSCFFGKLCKWALEGEYTHAHTQEMDFERLAGIAAGAGCSAAFRDYVGKANTARQIAESEFPEKAPFIRAVGETARRFISRLAGGSMEIAIYCWPFDHDNAWRWPL